MNKPDISKNFTLEDIHIIREYNAERRKKLTLKERLSDIRKNADKCEKDIEKYKSVAKSYS